MITGAATAQIQFALDVQTLFDQQTLHNAAGRTGLRRDKRHAQHFGGEFAGFGRRFRELHAAAFAAAAGVDLGFDDHYLRAQALGRGASGLGRRDHFAARRGDAEAAQDFFGLIFVNLHRPSVSARLFVVRKLRSLAGTPRSDKDADSVGIAMRDREG